MALSCLFTVLTWCFLATNTGSPQEPWEGQRACLGSTGNLVFEHFEGPQSLVLMLTQNPAAFHLNPNLGLAVLGSELCSVL